jgi:D-alanine-D-alanine ligase
MGGYSSEFAISIKSGEEVYKHLNRNHYNAYRVIISKKSWICLDANHQEYPIDKNNFSTRISGEDIIFDCVFNTVHGTPGEDGPMQAYFALLQIPQTSCNMYQAALTFNKRDTLSVLKPYGIKCATSYYLNKGDRINEKEIIEKVGLPCFVKANKAGSSYGITKVYKKAEFQNAIATAFAEDDEILVESFLDGIEVSVGVINYQNKLTVLPITEIVSENDFFDFEAKYEGKSQEITPARISSEQADLVRIEAKKIYRILKMDGLTRSDFIFHDGLPYFIEINATPGLSEESIIPQQALSAGIALTELFDNTIAMAFAKHDPKL